MSRVVRKLQKLMKNNLFYKGKKYFTFDAFTLPMMFYSAATNEVANKCVTKLQKVKPTA